MVTLPSIFIIIILFVCLLLSQMETGITSIRGEAKCSLTTEQPEGDLHESDFSLNLGSTLCFHVTLSNFTVRVMPGTITVLGL